MMRISITYRVRGSHWLPIFATEFSIARLLGLTATVVPDSFLYFSRFTRWAFGSWGTGECRGMRFPQVALFSY
jgi:hypothetical protein